MRRTAEAQPFQRAMSSTHEVTRLLAEWAKGNQQALDDLTPLVYRELRQLAASQLRRERKSHTLQPTALVHEAYLRLSIRGAAAFRTGHISSGWRSA